MAGARSEILRRADDRPWLVLLLLGVCYVVLIAPGIQRRFWHDELFTYYIAGQPTWPGMFEAIRAADYNPPLIFLVTRGSQALFGSGPIGTRLPVALGFLLGCAGVLIFLSRRAGYLAAGSAIALLWASDFFVYACEARPYGALLGAFGVALLMWDNISRGIRPRASVAVLALSTAAAMMSHVLAPALFLPLYVAEAVEFWHTRRPRWLLWCALVLPVAPLLPYVHMVRRFGTVYFPPAFQVSGSTLWLTALVVLVPVLIPLGIGATVVLAFGRRGTERTPAARWSRVEASLLFGALLGAGFTLALFWSTNGAFFPRYILTSVLALFSFLALSVISMGGYHRQASAAFLVIVLGWPLVHSRTNWRPEQSPPSAELTGIKPDLPIVAASGLTFIEANHYESREFTSRLYYLVDRDSAIRYANATIFEQYPRLTRWFPIRSHFAPFKQFTEQHRRFLVLGTPSYPEDWLLRKLAAERIAVAHIKRLELPYKDKDIYEVAMPETRPLIN